MKARVKATGEIVDVNECGQAFKDMRMDYMDTKGRCYKSEDLDFNDNTPFDYWTRLEHQAGIAAMQGMLSNPEVDLDYKSDECMPQAVAATAYIIAHALVEKYKKEEK